MNNIWAMVVDFLPTILILLTQAYGGNVGLAIITVSLMVRLTLLPLTLRLARRVREREAMLRKLQPELERLKTRYRNNPEKLTQATVKLYKRHNFRPVDRFSLIGNLVQLPFIAGLWSAIRQGLGAGGRFLWIADITRPDLLLSLLVAGLAYVASLLNPNLQQQSRNVMLILPVLLTLVFTWRLSAGFGLYWAASTGVNILQTLILRRELVRAR